MKQLWSRLVGAITVWSASEPHVISLCITGSYGVRKIIVPRQRTAVIVTRRPLDGNPSGTFYVVASLTRIITLASTTCPDRLFNDITHSPGGCPVIIRLNIADSALHIRIGKGHGTCRPTTLEVNPFRRIAPDHGIHDIRTRSR